jgi:hypothetical protein
MYVEADRVRHELGMDMSCSYPGIGSTGCGVLSETLRITTVSPQQDDESVISGLS